MSVSLRAVLARLVDAISNTGTPSASAMASTIWRAVDAHDAAGFRRHAHKQGQAAAATTPISVGGQPDPGDPVTFAGKPERVLLRLDASIDRIWLERRNLGRFDFGNINGNK